MCMKKYSIILIAVFFFVMQLAAQQKNIADDFMRNKIKGLITGTVLGDALGGPIEFQGHPEIQASPNPPKLWTDTNNIMNDAELKAAKERMYFREYKYILPHVQSYGSWTENAPPVSLINRKGFDYTEWRRDLWKGETIREVSSRAMAEYKQKS